VAAQQKRRGGGRKHPGDERIGTGGGHARGDRRLEHLAGLSRVANDKHLGPVGFEVGDGCSRKAKGQVRSQKILNPATDAIRAKERARH
jgi:hypothetical protein